MYQPPFSSKPLFRLFPDPLPSAGKQAVYPGYHARLALNGYMDAYLFHRHLCRRISQGQAIDLDELWPPLAQHDEIYLESFSAFVIGHTLPAIRQIFHESGHSNRERRRLLDAVLRKLRNPEKVRAEQQALAMKV
jgi:hypothetical protein